MMSLKDEKDQKEQIIEYFEINIIDKESKIDDNDKEKISTYLNNPNDDTTTDIINTLIESAKQKKESLEKYSQKNLDDFVNIDNKYKFSINDENYCNFLLEHLAGIMLKLADMELVKFLTNKILDREKLLSKPKPFFYKEEITAMESASEDESIMSVEDIDRESLNLSDDEETKDINFDGYDVENADDVWEKD